MQATYDHWCKHSGPIAEHLPALRAAAEGLPLAVEFGVQRGCSSSALLMGASRVISCDVQETPDARELEGAAEGRWDYKIQSSLEAPVIETPLLFIDSLHTYEHLRAELARHADAVSDWLIFHDTITYGSIAEAGHGYHAWNHEVGVTVPIEHMGIRPAIDELMIRDPSWRIASHALNAHGLLTLWRAK